MYIAWKIERTPLVGSKYDDASKETLTGFYNTNVRVSLGSTKDSFQFYLQNNHNQYDGYFNLKDKITIYRKRNSTSFTDDDILMIGVISSLPETRNSRMASLLIKGYNYTEAILGALIVTDPSNLTVPYALKNAVEAIGDDSPETFPVTWYVSNPTLKQDGVTAFPIVDEQWFNVSFATKIEKYSQNQYTEDGTYMYWIDKDNQLHWQPKKMSVDYTFDPRTELYLSVKPDVDSDSIINYVQMQGGSDPRGSAISVTYVDEASKAKNGAKYQFNTDNASYCQSINAKDIISIGGDYSEGTLPSSVSGFSYPYHFSWMTVGVTASSDDDYVGKLRTYVKSELTKQAIDIVELSKNGLLKLDYTFNAGQVSWGLGDLIQVQYKNSSGVYVPKSLRVKDIQYTTTTDVFQLEEDVGTI